MKRTIYEEALDVWGEDSQIEQLIEECSELILALQKLKRHRRFNQGQRVDRINDVLEEIADVKIMIRQIELIFPPEEVAKYESIKLDRLRKRLDKYAFRNIDNC